MATTLYLLALVAVVASQLFFVLLVWAELDGSIGHDPHHGGRVPPPQAEQPILHVSAVDEPKGLLGGQAGGEYDGLDREMHGPLHSPHNNSNFFKIFKIERVAKGSKHPLFHFYQQFLWQQILL